MLRIGDQTDNENRQGIPVHLLLIIISFISPGIIYQIDKHSKARRVNPEMLVLMEQILIPFCFFPSLIIKKTTYKAIQNNNDK